MLTSEQKDELADLEKDVSERKKNLTLIPKLEAIGFTSLVIAMVLVGLARIFDNPQVIFFIAMVSTLIFFILVMIMPDELRKRAKRKSPSNHKLTKYYTLRIMSDIADYFNPKRTDTDKEKQKRLENISKNGNSLLTLIKKTWHMGDFALGKETLGDHISKFKDLLSTRLVYPLKELSTEEKNEPFLKDVDSILFNFVFFLDNLTIPGLIHINEMLERLPQSSVEEKKSLLVTIREQPISNKLVLISGALMTIIPLATYFIGMNFFNLTNSEAFMTSATIWVACFVAFFAEIILVFRSKERTSDKT